IHLKDTTRFCPKKERESEQTSFRIKTSIKTRKGAFIAPPTSYLIRKMGTQPGKISVVLGAGG
uniref:Uncharacterized protein n=2 Tax=Sus scrofa TaxID=9823 RepID=A0A8W4FQG0_PIG